MKQQPAPESGSTSYRILRNTFYAQFAAFVLSSLTTSIGTLVDGAVIGQYLGVDSMAAFGIISPLMIVFNLIGAVISSGARNRYTRLMGFGQVDEAQGVFSLSCALSVGMATLLLLVCLPLARPISILLGASGNSAYLLPKARDYLIGIAVGLPAMNAMRTLNAYMPVDNDLRMPLISSITLTAADIVLDLLVVFVLHGDTLEMGLATSLSYYAATAVQLLHFRRKTSILRFSFRNIRWREAQGILKHGLPTGICRAGVTLRSAYMNNLLAAIATTSAVAAFSVNRQADSLLNPLTIGMANTVATMAGVLYGEENRTSMRLLFRAFAQTTLLVTAGFAVVGWLLAPQFVSLYIRNDPEALELSIHATRAYMLGLPLFGLNINYLNYIQSVGKNRLASVAALMLECVFLIISAALLSGWIGAEAVWYAFPAAQLLGYVMWLCVIAVYSRRQGLRGMDLLDRALLLPASFDVPVEDRLERSISSLEEVSPVSRDVWDFCTVHGCDPRRRYLLSLSVEEMAKNVIIHGFRGSKKHSLDLRVLKKGDDYILRIRDDCWIFDPLKQIRLFSADDLASHFGLQMITSLAKETRYACLLRLNNLVVKV